MIKKIVALVLFLVLGKLSYSQGYPLTQLLGSDSTLVISKGATQSRFINVVFTDTNQANNQRIKNYPGAQIATNGGGIKLWLRNQTATAWVPINVGSGNNIYTIDGTLTGNRILTGVNNSLTFTGLSNFNVSASDSVKMQTPQQYFILSDTLAKLVRSGTATILVNSTNGAARLVLDPDGPVDEKKYEMAAKNEEFWVAQISDSEAIKDTVFFVGVGGKVGIRNNNPDSVLTVGGGVHLIGGLKIDNLISSPGTKQLRINAQGQVSIADTTIDAGGTVTSVATNNGSGITGGTITTSGTLAIDTTNVIATKASVASGLAGKLNISDTATMLSPYVNNVGYGLGKTSQTIYADSATLSAYYLRRKDSLTATNSLGYVTKQVLADTAAAIRGADAGGTVTSVATNNGTGITGGTITTTGTLAIDTTVISTRAWRQKGIDSVASLPKVTSVGLTMPTAFNVANSPITSSGTIAVTGAGTAAQYIRGDGQLATFPATGAGGSAIYYYLNGSVNSSVVGYQQMANSAIIGAGTDFTLTGNGLIAQFLTDSANPNRVLIPGGAWNTEMFFSVSSTGGNQKFYLELLKYDGTTFTPIASSILNPEEITGGTSTDLYLTSIAVPQTTLLTTDRLAIRVYIVDNAVGRTVTLHTENSNLCQITTTFAGGISSLNGLTANTQYLATGTSGTDFNISSLTDTHTFNLPVASATNTGKLSNTDWSTFNNKVGGSLVSGYLTKATGTNTIDTSQLFQSSGLIGIGTTSPTQKLDVRGRIAVNTSGQSFTINNFYPSGGQGNNIFIGNGGQNGIYNSGFNAAWNTSLGINAFLSSTTGFQNTAIGYRSLETSTTGNNNVAVGASSMLLTTSGTQNVAVGTMALSSNTTGQNNTAVGQEAGATRNNGAGSNSTSTNSVYLGYYTSSSASGNTNEIVIGSQAEGNGSNSVTLGNTSITKTVLRENVGIGTTAPDSALTVQNGTHLKRGVRMSGLPSAPGTKALRIDASGTISTADTLIDAGGTVTSVATNNGTGITGGTITTSGTLAIDTLLVSTRAWRQKGIDSVQANLTAGLATKLNISDTAAMLSPYARTNVVNAALATKLNISDTASMLNPYLRKVDTTAMLSPYKTFYPRTAISLTTTGSSGAATYNNSTGVLNIPVYTDAFTGTVTSVATNNGTGITGGTITTSGTLAIDTLLVSTRAWRQKGIDSVTSLINTNISGTTNYIPKFTSSSAIGNSVIYESGGSIGIGTTSPASYDASGNNLVVYENGNAGITIATPSTGYGNLFFADGTGSAAAYAGYLEYNHNNNALAFGTNSTERMRLDASGNLGLGTSSPSSKLNVSGGNITVSDVVSPRVLATGNTATGFPGYNLSNTTQGYEIIVRGNQSNTFQIRNSTASTDLVIIDPSGNLGLGVTPSAWGNTTKAIELQSGSIESRPNVVALWQNAYFDGTSPRYSTSNYATNYYQNGGQHVWLTAPSGTAGNVVSFTQAMTLDASGRLGIGTTSPTSLLTVYGNGNSANQIHIKDANANGTRFDLGASNSEVTLVANYSSSAVPMTFYTGGTERMRITSGGNVGIGTTSPQRTLDVIGSSNDVPAASFGKGLSIGNWSGIGFGYVEAGNSNYRKAALVFERTGGAAEGKIHILNNNTADISSASLADARLTITPSGNVGIGTSSPVSILNLYSSLPILRWQNPTSGTGVSDGGDIYLQDSDFWIRNIESGILGFATSGVERMRITSGGNVGIGTTSPTSLSGYTSLAINGTNGGITYYGVNGTDVGRILSNGTSLYFDNVSTGDLIYRTSTNSERMRITSGGELLINTTSDAGDYKLQVNGNGYFNGVVFAKDGLISDKGASNSLAVGSHMALSNPANSYQYLLQLNASYGLDFWNYNGTWNVKATLSSGGNLDLTGSIKTGAPSGGTAKPFKIGAAAVVSPTSPNRTIEIEIDGVTYYLSAKTTND